MESMSKITARHLSRLGYVYIRQSTTYQVSSNTESTLRQYGLRERLIALGWDESLVSVIDDDLGISGKSADNREGFTRLMADVANGKVGAVACIEASRLSRCSADWSRLIEICTMTETLLIDTDGIYSPNDFNDRLLLGLKGTMSEAELHFLQERMRGGLLNKAKRGELKRYLPIGYEYDYDDNIVKTPDLRVREAVEQFFDLFRIKKTGCSVVAYYAENNMSFPVRPRIKSLSHEIRWEKLNLERAIAILHNPFYTGAYIFGRTQMKWTESGKRRPVPVPEEEWHVNIPGHHEAYITQEEFNANQAILQANTQQWGGSDKKTSPREGFALLQGICYCGLCGYRMTPIYSTSQATGRPLARYTCSNTKGEGNPEKCHHSVPAEIVDEAISHIVEEKLKPEALALTIQVQNEVSRRKQDHLRYFELQLESARHEEELARVRYMSVDPTNRLVALQLETEWNKKIRLREEASSRYEEEANKTNLSTCVDIEEAAKSIGENFITVWSNPSVLNEDKKRIVRYLIKDVTLLKSESYHVKIGICFQGGATHEVDIEIPKPRYMRISITSDVLEFLEQNAGSCNYQELAEKLNDNGFSRACHRPFNRSNVFRIMKDYSIKSMKQRYLDKGWISMQDAAVRQGISKSTLRYRVKAGNYTGRYKIVEENGTMLFDPETIPKAASRHERSGEEILAVSKGKCRAKAPSAIKKTSLQKPKHDDNGTRQKILEFLESNAESHINRELAKMLNEQGFSRPNGKPFDGLFLNQFMRSNGIKTIKQRYLEKGWLTINDAADKIGILPIVLRIRAETGKFTGDYIVADGNNALLFDPNTLAE